MNEYVPRIESVSAERAVQPVRPVAAVAPVQPGAGAGQAATQGEANADSGEQARREHMASASDYARVQARIADILAELDTSSASPAEAHAHADAQMAALRPEPTVVIPLPPARIEVIEQAVAVARAMAEKAALTRAAQANVAVGTVDQMLAVSA